MDSKKEDMFVWFDGAKTIQTKFTDVDDKCNWVIVEFIHKSEEIHSDPHIQMEMQCVAWKPHADQEETPSLLDRCREGLMNHGDNGTNFWCQKALGTGISRYEDLIRYGESV